MAAAEVQPTQITAHDESFTLEDRSDTFSGDIDALRGKLPNVGMAEVIGDVNRRARTGHCELPTSDSVGFCWNDGDDGSTTWFPQGITGSWDAAADGKAAGHQIIVVSWYDRHGVDGEKRGARITFVNYDDPDKPAYRHVLLVVPDRDGSFHELRAAHAGGIAWVGDKLYVADTTEIRVFDLTTIWRTRADSTHQKIGLDDGKAYAADYRYAIPQLGYYKPRQDLRFSSMSLDRTSTPNSLITAEYKEDPDGIHSTKNAKARIVRWNLGADGFLAATGNEVRSSAAYLTSRANINGAITHGAEFVLTTSEFDRKPAWIHRAKLGTSQQYTRIPVGGPEDLTYQPQGERMWTLTEYDKKRTVFGIPLSSIGSR